MKFLRILIAATLLLAASAGLSAQISFKRAPNYSRDTVTSGRYYLVCVTDPGTQVTVNGEPVKVYATGAFGKELRLKNGDNRIEVVLSRGSEKQTQEVNVYYAPPQGLVSRPVPEPELQERLFYVVTKEDGYLTYSPATDRLGGSKMGYLDPGIVMKVTGEIGDLYRVQLSANRFAYIGKEYVEPTPKSARIVSTNNIGITNAGSHDRIRLSLPDRLPYASHSVLDPTTIVVDVFGAMNNSNWITQYDELEMIDYLDVQQVDSDVLRLVVKLKDKYAWGWSVGYDGNVLVIDVKHAPANLSLKGLKVGLDAGHGGSALGAVSATGLNEKDINLSIVRELEGLLQKKGATVVLSRLDDREMSMPERKRIFREADIDLLVSVHNNAGGSPLKPMGTSTYYKHITNRDLAATLLKHMLELDVPSFGLTGNFNFSLNAPTEYPNALVECLFMSSLPDEEKLADPATHKMIAEKIVAGLEDYLRQVSDAKGLTGKKKK